MFTTIGILTYYDNPYKLAVGIDDEIGRYYRSLIPKYFNVRKPLYSSHVSVIRKEVPQVLGTWRKFHGEKVPIHYDNFIYNDELYFWLNAFSPQLEKIRRELGLSNLSEYTKSPDGQHRFHITIANTKHHL